MRITFVLPYASLGGGIRVVATYAARLQKRGHSVSVVSVSLPPMGMVDRARHLLTGQPIPARRPRVTYFDSLPVDHRVLAHAGPVSDADVPDADVVVATWWETAEWVARLSPSKGAQVLFIQGFEVTGGPRDARLEATWRLPMHKVVVSPWLGDLARERFGDPCVSLVSNPVDTDVFTAAPRSKQAVPTVGLVYTPQECKGPDIMARATCAAAERVPALRVVAFGLEAMRGPEVFPRSLRFERSPAHARMVELYSSCDAWLFGSRAEGFGLPILEAMACRTPVIATPAGAARELLAGGGGFLVGPEDWAGMAERIVEVAGLSEGAWREMSDRARATAETRGIDASTDAFEHALGIAVERAGAGEIAGGAGARRAG